MSEKYSTDDLIKIVLLSIDRPRWRGGADLVVARLRAADKLCEAAGAYRDLATCYRLGKKPNEVLFERLEKAGKAIANYKGKKP